MLIKSYLLKIGYDDDGTTIDYQFDEKPNENDVNSLLEKHKANYAEISEIYKSEKSQ